MLLGVVSNDDCGFGDVVVDGSLGQIGMRYAMRLLLATETAEV